MSRFQRRTPARKRVGRVSYYFHHGAWYVYYRDGRRQIRRRAGGTEATAAQVAAECNAQLTSEAPTRFSFEPISVADLQQQYLSYHEHVARSSVATVQRYRAATQHLVRFAASLRQTCLAHQLDAEEFVRHLHDLRVAPNGHANSVRRPLRDKGIRFILETCRSLYAYAAKKRHLPPYAENPFTSLANQAFRNFTAKPIFVFGADTELRFWQSVDDWAFPLHFLLAKTGMRPGEVTHLAIDDLDLATGWIHVRNKPALGWTIKTGRERGIPLIDELVAVLRRAIGSRTNGPVFLRPRFLRKSVPPNSTGQHSLASEADRRVNAAERNSSERLSRRRALTLRRAVWREAGAVDPDGIRTSFIQTMEHCGLHHATCPKSWRHSLATLMQEANVDPLIRQLILGHSPSYGAGGVLGTTMLYTHTRPETLRREFFAALRLWPASLDFARAWAAGGAA